MEIPGDPMMLTNLIDRVDARAGMMCAIACAAHVLRIVPESPEHLHTAIDLAERYVRREGSEEDCRHSAATALIYYLYPQTPRATALAAITVELLLLKVVGDDVPDDRGVPYSTVVAMQEKQTRTAIDCGAEIRALILSILVDATHPTPEQSDAARERVQVAFDCVMEHGALETLSIPDLLAAHARAERLGLDWTDPVQRALAERVTDEEAIRALLR